MYKQAALAAVSIAVLLSSTNAMAAPTIVSGPTSTTVGTVVTAADLQADCTSRIRPSNPAGFTAQASGASLVTNSSGPVVSNYNEVASGDPTYGDPLMVELARNPGNDHQIFGRIDYTSITYPTVTKTWTETVTETDHWSYGCRFFNKMGHEAVDQAITGLSSATWTVTTVTGYQDVVPGGTQPLSDPVFKEYVPVCDNKPNGWAPKGNPPYDESLGTCSQETYDSLAGYPWTDQ